MITPEDAELAERDPALPGLVTLLDQDAFAAALRCAAPDADIGPAQARYVRYKPGTSCLVAYRLHVGDTQIDAYARAQPRDDLAKLGPARSDGPVAGPRVLLRGLAVAVYRFPDDRRLRSLAAVADEARRRAVLARTVPDRPELWEARLRRLRYKPERRFVAELSTDAGARALLKIYEDGDYHSAGRNAKVFASNGSLRIARRLGRSHRDRLLVLEWLQGRDLMEALAAAEPVLDATAATGAALAELHAQRPRRLGRHTPQAEAHKMREAAAAVGAVCPGLTERARRLAAAITAELAGGAPDHVTIHGDFSADQVLVGGGGTAIVDLDHAVRGDPRADLGSFAARLEHHALAGKLSAGRAGSATVALLDGYCDRASAQSGAVDWVRPYTAARLLRLAPEPFRYREAGWNDRVEAILDRAEAILDGR